MDISSNINTIDRYIFVNRPLTELDWHNIESSSDSNCCVSRKWSEYITHLGYSPFVLCVYCDSDIIGYFIATRLRILFFHIIGAPIESLGYQQGLILLHKTTVEERLCIYKALAQWIVSNHLASYIQVDDWQLRIPLHGKVSGQLHDERLVGMGLQYSFKPTLCLDLDQPLEAVWASFSYSSAKYCVNKARKKGLHVRIINKFEDIGEFVDIHYDQLCDVVKRHKDGKPKPSQKKHRMLAQCQTLFPDRILMLQVIGNDTNDMECVMSSAIFFIDTQVAHYSTGASYQRYMSFSPNELMIWEAVSIMHNRGIKMLDFCGVATYKLKFGTVYQYVPRLIFTKWQWLYAFKIAFMDTFHRIRHFFVVVRNRFGL